MILFVIYMSSVIGITINESDAALPMDYLCSHGINVSRLGHNKSLLYTRELEPYAIERFKNDIRRLPDIALYNKLNDDFGYISYANKESLKKRPIIKKKYISKK